MFFEYPKLLWLLLIPAVLILIYIYRELTGKNPYFTVSAITPWSAIGGGIKQYIRHIPFILRIIAISAIILAIARPRSSSVYERVDTEGTESMRQRI